MDLAILSFTASSPLKNVEHSLQHIQYGGIKLPPPPAASGLRGRRRQSDRFGSRLPPVVGLHQGLDGPGPHLQLQKLQLLDGGRTGGGGGAGGGARAGWGRTGVRSLRGSTRGLLPPAGARSGRERQNLAHALVDVALDVLPGLRGRGLGLGLGLLGGCFLSGRLLLGSVDVAVCVYAQDVALLARSASL